MKKTAYAYLDSYDCQKKSSMTDEQIIERALVSTHDMTHYGWARVGKVTRLDIELDPRPSPKEQHLYDQIAEADLKAKQYSSIADELRQQLQTIKASAK